MALAPLPPSYEPTRRGLHAVAAFVLGPARKARTGRIGLRPVDGGFGTPPFDDGRALAVIDDRLGWLPGDESVPLSTVRAAAEFAGVEVSADPGVGHDLPPYEPDTPLAVDVGASRLVAAWFALGFGVITSLFEAGDVTAVAEPQLWPEHFDVGAVAAVRQGTGARAQAQAGAEAGAGAGANVNLGFSPGDAYSPAPYVYVGPHDPSGLAQDSFWNAPFGAALGYDALRGLDDPAAAATAFMLEGLARLPV